MMIALPAPEWEPFAQMDLNHCRTEGLGRDFDLKRFERSPQGCPKVISFCESLLS